MTREPLRSRRLDLGRATPDLESLFDQLPGNVIRRVRRADGRYEVKFIGSGCMRQFGVNPGRVLSEKRLSFPWVHREDRSRLRAAYEESGRSLCGIDCRVRIISDFDRSVRWARVIGQPEKRRNGDIVWNLLVIDVTGEELALADAQNARVLADQANASKSRFLAAASHDLRQPIQAIEFLVASLRARPGLGAAADGVCDTISRCVDSLATSVEGLLDISRLEAGGITPRVAHTTLADLFAKLEATFRPIAIEKGLALELVPNGLVVNSDPSLLLSLLANLLSNAIRFTPFGVIRIQGRSGTRRGEVRIDVIDTGPGISPRDRRRIFEPFVRLGNGGPEGIGLGLSIVDRITRLLGHRLQLKSVNPHGTHFTLTVPRGVASCAPADAGPTYPAHQLLGLRVLIVEDTESVANALISLLSTWGCEVRQGAPTTAVNAAMEFKPEIVVSDLSLESGLDGVHVLDAVTSLKPSCRGILLTGETGPERLRQAQEHRYPILVKPVRAGQLRALLESEAN